MATNRLAQFFEDVGKQEVENSRQALAQAAYGRQLAESALGTSANVLGTFGRLAKQGLIDVPTATALYAMDRTPEADLLSQKIAFDRDQIFNRLTNPTQPNPDPIWAQVLDAASVVPAIGASGRGINIGSKLIGRAAPRVVSLFDDVSKTSQEVAKVNKVRSIVKQDLDEARNAVNAAKQAKEAYKTVGSSYDEAYNAGSDFKRLVERAMQTGNEQKFLLPKELAKHNKAIADAASEARGLRESFNFLTGEYGQASKVAKAADEALAKAVKATAKRTTKVAEKTGKSAAKGYMGMQAARVPASAAAELMSEPAGLSQEDVEKIISNREKNSSGSTTPSYVEDYAYAHEANPIEPTSATTPRDYNGALDWWNDSTLSKVVKNLPLTQFIEYANTIPQTTEYAGSPTYNYVEGRPKVITPAQQDIDLTNLPHYKKLQEIAANAKTQEKVIEQLTQQQAARRKALADESDNSIARWFGHAITIPFALRRGESPALTWARTQAGIEANDAELSAINQKLAAAAGLPTELELAQAMNSAAFEAITKNADIQSKKDKSYLQSLLADYKAQTAAAIGERNTAKNQLEQQKIDIQKQELSRKEKESIEKRVASIEKTIDEAVKVFKSTGGQVNFLPADATLRSDAKKFGLDPDYFVKRKYDALSGDSENKDNKLLSTSNMMSANKASAFSK